MGFIDWLLGGTWDDQQAQRDSENKYSWGNLRSQLYVLYSTPELNQQNRVQIINALREITELLIWDDQQQYVRLQKRANKTEQNSTASEAVADEATFFDFFLEQELSGYILNLLKTFARERKHDSSALQFIGQLLQMLTILFENVRCETSMYSLLSNNFVNEVIIWGSVLREDADDFSSEEAIAYYVTLLKTLSLKLTDSTVNFFFDEKQKTWARIFPLYSFSLPFAFHPSEPMVRIAIRTILLNIYRLNSIPVRRYLLNEEKSNTIVFWNRHFSFVLDNCQDIDTIFRAALMGQIDDRREIRHRLGNTVAEFSNQMLFLKDVFETDFPEMNRIIMELLNKKIIISPILESLIVSSRAPSPNSFYFLPTTSIFLLYHINTGIRIHIVGAIIFQFIFYRCKVTSTKLLTSLGSSKNILAAQTSSTSLGDLCDEEIVNPYRIALFERLKLSNSDSWDPLRLIFAALVKSLQGHFIQESSNRVSDNETDFDRESFIDVLLKICPHIIENTMHLFLFGIISRYLIDIFADDLSNEQLKIWTKIQRTIVDRANVAISTPGTDAISVCNEVDRPINENSNDDIMDKLMTDGFVRMHGYGGDIELLGSSLNEAQSAGSNDLNSLAVEYLRAKHGE